MEDGVLLQVAGHAAEGGEGEHGDGHVDHPETILHVEVVLLQLEPQRPYEHVSKWLTNYYPK
jgi:hypothetical protein